MLSNTDIIKELNKNIFIYPLTEDNIRGSTVNLKASNFAWSLKAKNSIVKCENSEKWVEIPPHDTGLIETEEVIYTTSKISGTYHSKVKLVSNGLGHIGTTLDPTWCGNSLIAVHNFSDFPYKIKVGETFVSIIFYYLRTSTTKCNTNPAGQTEVLKELGITSDLIPCELESEWRKDPGQIVKRCMQPEEQKKIESLRKEFGRPFWKSKLFLLFAQLVLIIVIGCIIWHFDKKGEILKWYLVAGLSGIISSYSMAFINLISEN